MCPNRIGGYRDVMAAETDLDAQWMNFAGTVGAAFISWTSGPR